MLAVLVLLAAMLGPRLPSAGMLGYMQHLWFDRIERFFAAMKTASFSDTFQGPHPGVTLMWILGTVVELRAWMAGPLGAFDRLWTLEVTEMLWSSLVIVLLFFALRRTLIVYGSSVRAAHWSALLACVLAALDPMFLTLTQVMTLDGPLAAHVALALCLFLTALQTEVTRDGVLAGIATALAVLTKMSALIFVFGMEIYLLVRILRAPAAAHRRRVALRHALTFTGVVVILVFACWPTLWVSPLGTARRIVMTDQQAEQVRAGKLDELLANRDQQAGLDAILDVVLHPHRPGNARVVYGRTTSAWLYYPAIVLFKTPPLTLLLAVLGVGLALVQQPRRAADPLLRLVGQLTAWNVLYLVCLSIAAKKTWRYLATLEVLLELCAGLTLSWLTIQVARRHGRIWALALVVPIALQIGHTLTYAPHFIAYNNPLAGGRAVADEYLMLYWGEGAGEAARYMQAHARAQPVRFITENWDLANLLRIMLGEPELVSRAEEAEFLVISYREVLLQTMSRGARFYWSSRPPEYVATIHGVPYVWVYRLEKGTR